MKKNVFPSFSAHPLSDELPCEAQAEGHSA
jgi:hypothetical protein